MKQIALYIVVLISVVLFSCDKDDVDWNKMRYLELAEIQQEYTIVDSLNNIEDRSQFETDTLTIGVDERNGRIIVRTCGPRSIECIPQPKHFTLLYLNSDTVSCKKNGGIWIVDCETINGKEFNVGCAPDAINETLDLDCGCGD